MTRRTNIPLGALRAFEAAARLGRMTLAAEELSVTHGAISRQVGQLETHLGVYLFEGPRNRPTLTAGGLTLLNALTPAFDQIDVALRTVGDHDPKVVDVACFSTFAMRWLIPRLHSFQHAYPAIDIRLSTDERPAVTSSRRFDVDITLVGATESSPADDVILFAESLGVVVAPALLRRTPRFKIESLADVSRLSTRTRAGAWREWAQLAGVDIAFGRVRKPSQFEHYTFAIEAAANGLGACVVPYHLVADDIANKRLAAPFGFVPSQKTYVARRLQPRNRSARHFTDWLRREAARIKGPAAHDA